MMAVAATLMPTTSVNAGNSAPAEKAVHCSIRVSVSSFEPDDCVVTADENLITVKWGNNPSFKVSLQRRPNDHASLVVDGLDLRNPQGLQLGDVAYDDISGCWQGNGNKVCYTLQGDIDQEMEGDRAEYLSDLEEDPGTSPAPVGNLARSLASGAAAAGLTCIMTDEDLARPSNRAMMRAMALSDYAGDVPRSKSFMLTASGNLTVDGRAAVILSREGNLVVAQAWNGIARTELPPTFSEEERQHWQNAQPLFEALGDASARMNGLDQRVYVLDFDQRVGQLATVENNALIEQQQIFCQ